MFAEIPRTRADFDQPWTAFTGSARNASARRRCSRSNWELAGDEELLDALAHEGGERRRRAGRAGGRRGLELGRRERREQPRGEHYASLARWHERVMQRMRVPRGRGPTGGEAREPLLCCGARSKSALNHQTVGSTPRANSFSPHANFDRNWIWWNGIRKDDHAE